MSRGQAEGAREINADLFGMTKKRARATANTGVLRFAQDDEVLGYAECGKSKCGQGKAAAWAVTLVEQSN